MRGQRNDMLGQANAAFGLLIHCFSYHALATYYDGRVIAEKAEILGITPERRR